MQKLWTYAAPALTGLGALLLVLGQLGRPPLLLIVMGSAVFVAVTFYILRLQRAPFTIVMNLAALVWLWLAGWPINRIVPWWIGFLALTIVGERLDLSRFQKPSPWSPPLLYLAFGVFLGGLILLAFRPGSRGKVARRWSASFGCVVGAF